MSMSNVKKQRNFLSILLSFVLFAFAIAGCDTSVDDETTRVDPDATKIGILVPASGGLSSVGVTLEDAARLAVKEINAAGGVNGKMLDVIVKDSRRGVFDFEEQSINSVRSLADSGVVGIVGPYSSGTVLNIAETVSSGAVPIISPSATSPLITGLVDNDLIWRTPASDAFQGVFLANKIIEEFAAINNASPTLSLVWVDDAYGEGLAQKVTERFEALGGTIQESIPFTQGNVDANAVINQAVAGQPDALVLIAFSIEAAQFYVPLGELNPPQEDLKIFGVDGFAQQSFLDNVPPAIAVGTRGSLVSPPTSSTNYKTFAQAYESATGISPDQYTDNIYDAVYLMALAMAKGGENTSAAIVNNLQKVSRADGDSPVVINIGSEEFSRAVANIASDIDFNGAGGDIDFDSNGDVTSGNYKYWEIQNVGGALQFVTLDEQIFRQE